MKPGKLLYRVLCILILISIFFTTSALGNPDENIEDQSSDIISVSARAEPTLEAESAILIDQESGKIIYKKNIKKRLYPASTTKIMTALLALEKGDLSDIVTVGLEANLIPIDGTIAGLDLNEQISFENLIWGMMLPSGNDAAYTIAVHMGKKISGNDSLSIKDASQVFFDLMNERVKEITGTEDSHFVNPHGYHDSQHYTTAYDLAMIAREAMKFDFFREVVSTIRYQMEDWNGVDKNDPTKKEIRYWKNTNKLIDEYSDFYFPDATGIKTGYTSHAGQCLVASATRGDLNLIAVVMRSSRDGKWKDAIKLFEYGFEFFKVHQVVEKGEIVKDPASGLPICITVDNSDPDGPGVLNPVAKESFKGVFDKADIEKIETKIDLLSYVRAPIRKNERVGSVTYILNGEVLKKIDLLAGRDIEKNKTLLDIITADGGKKGSSSWWKWSAAFILLLLLFIYLKNWIKRRRRKRRYIYWRKY